MVEQAHFLHETSISCCEISDNSKSKLFPLYKKLEFSCHVFFFDIFLNIFHGF